MTEGNSYALRSWVGWGYNAQYWQRIAGPQPAFVSIRIIAINSCVIAFAYLECWRGWWYKGSEHTGLCSSHEAAVSLTARSPPALQCISTKHKGVTGCWVPPLECWSQEYLLYLVSYWGRPKWKLLWAGRSHNSHPLSRTRLCGLVQPILSFRNQKPHTVWS